MAKQSIPHPLPDDLVELIARRFRVLAEPMRIKLLDRLRDGGATVAELQEATGASQQNVSKHLGVLLQSGLVARRKDGNFAGYEIADDSVFELCEQVCGGLRRQLEELEALLGGGRMTLRGTACARGSSWPLERVLFALAGTMTLLSVALAVLVSPWFLLLTAFVGVNQWLYVVVRACPASIAIKRAFGLRSAIYDRSGR